MSHSTRQELLVHQLAHSRHAYARFGQQLALATRSSQTMCRSCVITVTARLHNDDTVKRMFVI